MNKMTMKKKNYTTPLTEFVVLKPIYDLMNPTLEQSDGRVDTEDPESGEIWANEDKHGGSWEDIWGAQ